MKREAKIAGAGPLADFEVGQRVMTVEGYPGTVTDVHEGPADLTTIYVTLDGGMGGGEYAEAELTPIGQQQASLSAAVVEAGVTHTAADDYPELGSILSDRLPPTLHQRIASKTAGAARTHADDEDYDDDLGASAATWICTGCGQPYDPANPEGDLHDHWTSYDGSGPHIALYLPPVPKSEQRASTTDLPEGQRAGYQEGYEQGKAGVTREPSQPDDPDFMAGYDMGWAEGVTVLREPANSWDIDDLGKDQIADVPSTVPSAFGPTTAAVDLGMPMAREADAFKDIRDWVKENGQPGSRYSYDWCRFRRNSHCWLPKGLNVPASERAGYAVWIPMDRGYCWRSAWETQEKCPTGMPGPRANGFTDATIPWEQGGQRNGEPDPGWTADADTYSPSTVPGGILASAAPVPGDHEFEPNPDPEQQHLCAICGVWRYSHAGEKPVQVAAGLVREAAFEFTASWKDVREKAKRIRTGGGVRIVTAHDNIVVGHIKGDNGVYETEIVSMPGRRNAATWACGCKWSSYSWGRSGPWKKYEGRMCSHALALQYEAQSRGMNGKAITPDSDQPAWMDGEPKAYTPARQLTSALHEASPLDDGLRSRLRSATTLEQAAQIMLTLARREEPQVLNDLQTLIAQNHGEMVGLEHRFKSEKSLLRKMKAEATLFRNPGECAMNMSDTLRFTALFSPEHYTQDTKDVLAGLTSRGYKIRSKNYWGRGDAYNGVNVALTTPTGHPVELQFHTEASFITKERDVHPIYEQWRVESDPNIKAILGHRMRDLFDMVPRPAGALSITDLKRQPMTPYKDINWYPGKAASLDGYRYLALHYIDGDPDTPDEVYAVLRVTDASTEVWENGQWLDDPEFGRYTFGGDPTSEEITEDEANRLLVQLANVRVAHHRPVLAQSDDDAPVHAVVAQMLADGTKYAEVRQMLLSVGIESPAKVVAAVRKQAFKARIDGEFVDVEVGPHGFYDAANGLPVDPTKIEFPKWHPTMGLDPADEKIASLHTAADDEPRWRVNGKPFFDGEWIEVEPDKWFRASGRGEIPARYYVSLSDGKWEWMASVSTFIGAPHEDHYGKSKTPRGSAKTLEQAQEKALAALRKDQEFFEHYEQRQNEMLSRYSSGEAQPFLDWLGGA